MKIAAIGIIASILMASAQSSAAERDARLFEMRTYYAAPGKLDDLNARFRNHTARLFEKHGMTNVGYWVPLDNPENKLIYFLAHPSREARQSSWKAFGADPDWKKAARDSEANGKLVAKIETLFLRTTDYSPEIKLPPAGSDRVFELRTYHAAPGKLPALHERFKDHTISLFAKHGMTNLFYWQLLPDQPAADSTLIYLLAHETRDAARKSFESFRADPAWISARKASEEKAGGSLTIADGVKSLFLKATDYSPMR